MTEASEDPQIRRFMRKHLEDVHAFLAGLLRHGQELGILHPDRDAEVEAWVTIGTVARTPDVSVASAEILTRSPGRPTEGVASKRSANGRARAASAGVKFDD